MFSVKCCKDIGLNLSDLLVSHPLHIFTPLLSPPLSLSLYVSLTMTTSLTLSCVSVSGLLKGMTVFNDVE